MLLLFLKNIDSHWLASFSPSPIILSSHHGQGECEIKNSRQGEEHLAEPRQQQQPVHGSRRNHPAHPLFCLCASCACVCVDSERNERGRNQNISFSPFGPNLISIAQFHCFSPSLPPSSLHFSLCGYVPLLVHVLLGKDDQAGRFRAFLEYCVCLCVYMYGAVEHGGVVIK